MTFESILMQAQVSLDPKHPCWLGKEHRTCEATGRLLTAVRALVDTCNERESKFEAEKAKLADVNSKQAAKIAMLEGEKHELFKHAVRVGLESIPELTQSQRERLLSHNGK